MLAAPVAMLLAAGAGGGGLAAVVPQGLPQVQERLSAEREAAAKLAGREATLLGRLTDLQRQIELESGAVRAAQARLRVAGQRAATAEARAAAAQKDVDEATGRIEPRLTARYRLGREGYLRFLLGSRSIADVLRRHRLFNALLESDLDALAVLRFRAEGAKAARDEVTSARRELADSVGAEAEKREALQGRVEQQRLLLASVQEERATHEQSVRELEEAERDLTARVVDLAKKEPPAPPPAMVAPEITLKASIRKARGKLIFPAERGRIEVRFGRNVDPRFGTVTVQQGIDVRAPLGTKVYAVWDGKVVHAGWFRGFGNLLIVDHGDSVFSLMAHLDSLEKAIGDSVRAGDEVGTVGDSGSLKGAYLHFELRDGQKPLDPEQWLSKNRKAPKLFAGAKGSSK
jgi:septal ring factor EnvC (AmiA/AmiB activator)